MIYYYKPAPIFLDGLYKQSKGFLRNIDWFWQDFKCIYLKLEIKQWICVVKAVICVINRNYCSDKLKKNSLKISPIGPFMDLGFKKVAVFAYQVPNGEIFPWHHVIAFHEL